MVPVLREFHGRSSRREKREPREKYTWRVARYHTLASPVPPTDGTRADTDATNFATRSCFIARASDQGRGEARRTPEATGASARPPCMPFISPRYPNNPYRRLERARARAGRPIATRGAGYARTYLRRINTAGISKFHIVARPPVDGTHRRYPPLESSIAPHPHAPLSSRSRVPHPLVGSTTVPVHRVQSPSSRLPSEFPPIIPPDAAVDPAPISSRDLRATAFTYALRLDRAFYAPIYFPSPRPSRLPLWTNVMRESGGLSENPKYFASSC